METKNFGKISFEPDSELEFPCGLPGFDSRRRFVAVRFVESDPLVYLQSLEDPDLCFITMPILAADPRYKLKVSGEDLDQLGLPQARQPRIGEDVLCLTVLSRARNRAHRQPAGADCGQPAQSQGGAGGAPRNRTTRTSMR